MTNVNDDTTGWMVQLVKDLPITRNYKLVKILRSVTSLELAFRVSSDQGSRKSIDLAEQLIFGILLLTVSDKMSSVSRNSSCRVHKGLRTLKTIIRQSESLFLIPSSTFLTLFYYLSGVFRSN